MKRYAEVLVDVANRRLDQSYHYLIPENLCLKIGMRVLVPLQNRRVQGLVVNVTEDLPVGMEKILVKPVLEILDKNSLVPLELIELANWMSKTTVCSVAQSLHTVWPLLKGKTEEWVTLSVSLKDSDVQTLRWLDSEAFSALSALNRSRKKALSLKVFLKRTGITTDTLEKLLKQKWVKKDVRFVSGVQTSVKEEPRLQTVGQENPPSTSEESPFRLTDEQSGVVSSVLTALEKGLPQTVLLHGVTGSGKTAVYRQLIAEVLAQGGDAILLVPEITLTSQTARYFEAQFGEQMIILHSRLGQKEKMKAWMDILSGQKKIVIGARSAVFAPLPHLRLIILDEEHDGAYKQDENPKYHAREVARKRMEQRKGVVLLGSATPSLEAYAAAKSGKISLLTMTERVGRQPLPSAEIVDMRDELRRGNRSMFSSLLQHKLRERIYRGEQTMLFLNRRGYSTFVVCRECGYVVNCPHCDVALTYHTQGQAMRCHYCDYQEAPPHICPNCGSRYIRFFGQGTQRVEDELQGLFPEVSILRLDFDTTRLKGGHQTILDKFRRQEALVLIGTQMMAKGLDFPNVTLVGVIAADQTLNMPDFRARERTFQLLTQVAGRAGRSTKHGEVVIQTYSPTEGAVVSAAHHDYEGFFWEEIRYRKERSYPPYTHIIRVMLHHEKEERVIRGANELGACLQQGMGCPEFENTDLIILGPAPAVLTRLRNQWRWQLSVKGTQQSLLIEFIHRGVQKFFKNAASNGIILNVEVDPLTS